MLQSMRIQWTDNLWAGHAINIAALGLCHAQRKIKMLNFNITQLKRKIIFQTSFLGSLLIFLDIMNQFVCLCISLWVLWDYMAILANCDAKKLAETDSHTGFLWVTAGTVMPCSRSAKGLCCAIAFWFDGTLLVKMQDTNAVNY